MRDGIWAREVEAQTPLFNQGRQYTTGGIQQENYFTTIT